MLSYTGLYIMFAGGILAWHRLRLQITNRTSPIIPNDIGNPAPSPDIKATSEIINYWDQRIILLLYYCFIHLFVHVSFQISWALDLYSTQDSCNTSYRQ